MQAKFSAAAIAILAFTAATPAFAQRGGAGDDVLVGGQTSFKAAAPAQAGASPTTSSDDVIVDGRIITGENPASSYPGFLGGVRVASGDVNGATASGGSRHPGGVNVLMGDGSVRNSVGGNKTESIGIAKTHTANPTRLSSLNGVGSVGQLAAPPGAPPAQAQNNIKQLGLASHNYDTSAGGDVNGDGKPDVIVGAGGSGAHVKSGTAGGGPQVKAFGAGRDTGPKIGGATHVKVFDGNTAAGARGSAPAVKTFDGGNAAAAAAGASKSMTMKGQKIGQN